MPDMMRKATAKVRTVRHSCALKVGSACIMYIGFFELPSSVAAAPTLAPAAPAHKACVLGNLCDAFECK